MFSILNFTQIPGLRTQASMPAPLSFFGTVPSHGEANTPSPQTLPDHTEGELCPWQSPPQPRETPPGTPDQMHLLDHECLTPQPAKRQPEAQFSRMQPSKTQHKRSQKEHTQGLPGSFRQGKVARTVPASVSGPSDGLRLSGTLRPTAEGTVLAYAKRAAGYPAALRDI
jgi:hypothetical protein